MCTSRLKAEPRRQLEAANGAADEDVRAPARTKAPGDRRTPRHSAMFEAATEFAVGDGAPTLP